MTVLSDVPGAIAVTGEPILLDGALATMLARVGPGARVHELAVVQGYLADYAFAL